MGYQTSYELTIVEGSNELIEELRSINEDASYAIGSNGDTEESCKWYSHVKDLKAFSLFHPEALFKLSGEGEESGDIWHEYYQNGKHQLCNAKITFDEFNEKLLR